MGSRLRRAVALWVAAGSLIAVVYVLWPPSIDEREVEFTADGLRLAGTLSLPPGPGPYPALVMISGTQADTRDAMVGDFPLFRAIAEGLARHGVAVLRYDDRGTGRSQGSHPWQYGLDALAGDAAAALRLLRREPRIDPRRVGLLGHSLGGAIALRTRTRGEAPAFLVLMASYATPGDELLLDYRRRSARVEGLEPDAAVERDRRLIAAVRSGADPSRLTALYRSSPAAAQERPLRGYDAYLLRYAATPLFRDFIDYDPLPELRRLDRPALALFGEGDPVVPPSLHQPLMAAALQPGRPGSRNRIMLLPGGSHDLLLAGNGEVRLADALPQRIAAWIHGLPGLLRDSGGL